MEHRVSLREIHRDLARYLKAAEGGERIVITRRGTPVAMLSPVPPNGEPPLDATRKGALQRILSQSHHLGGRAPSRDELYER